MKIGILTFHNTHNYGAFLQAYALQKKLIDLGFDAQIIDYQKKEFIETYYKDNTILHNKNVLKKINIVLKKSKNIFFLAKAYRNVKLKNKHFDEVISKEIIKTKPIAEKLDSIEKEYDIFLIGSDQVWNVNLSNYDYTYFLNFLSDEKVRISYASSFGKSKFNQEDYIKFSKYLSKFKKVLVREKLGKEMLKKECNINSEVVLDPTFLLDKNKWLEFGNKSTVKKLANKYVLIYLVGKDTNLYQAATNFAIKNKCKVVEIGGTKKIKVNGVSIISVGNAGPYEFIRYIENAEAIFTTSFHGTALSINLNKNFYYELDSREGVSNSRIEEVINIFNLYDNEIVSSIVKENTINWNDVNIVLEKEREKSQKLLLNAISLL